MVTTLDDPQGRPTVRELLKGVRARVFPVGRLDYHSAGLLLLTNDGELALRLTHPRYGIRKTYQVKVKGDPQPSQLAALASGVRLADGTTNPADVHILRQRDHKAWLSITLAEGKNRQVRRMCEAVGLSVEKLVRVAFGALKLGALAPGAWRHLEPGEVELLRRPAPPSRPARPPRGRQRPHADRRGERGESEERDERRPPGRQQRPRAGGGARRFERPNGERRERGHGGSDRAAAPQGRPQRERATAPQGRAQRNRTAPRGRPQREQAPREERSDERRPRRPSPTPRRGGRPSGGAKPRGPRR